MDARGSNRVDSDVLVVGGGAAGVAAAVTAARRGLKVTLVERYGFCGGGAVAGLSGTVCGLYEATEAINAKPKQVVFGFADEFCRRLEAKGGLGDPLLYGKTWARVHEPLVWREEADAMLQEAGVRVVFHAVASDVSMEGDRIAGVVIWTKQGPLDARAKVVVDASGDADVVAMAGLPSFIGDNGRVQNPTMVFRMMGVDIDRFVTEYGADTIMPEKISDMIRAKHNAGEYRLPRAKIWLFPTTRPNELLCNCTRVIGPDGRELNTLLHQDFTDAEIQGRLQAREYARFFRDNLVGCEAAFLNDTGVQVGVRQTRQVSGVKRLSNDDVVKGAKSSDGIAVSPWPIELHSGVKPRVEWLLNDYYEVPYGCFVPERGEGLLVAGRCLSAEHEAVASARVTAQCFSYGHAIGHAAVIVVRDGIAPRHIDGQQVRAAVNADGARLD
ncbi:FAD-dependent oxidoreductase [Bradyrhizobium sp. BRP56]|uniref:FAD-dependent oxidoreductase n=1 Tax=Bradyrhizobium sp. BRP56 TaxID=2793819 RepID=UPI001CD751B3|nr:FAD-dependent oxidoreductase [Bradyrhizobium sp. BRP56]MCA1396189.1 FAD-dependent oxidoreductase [Bradyrhizobium sp. BRP56]